MGRLKGERRGTNPAVVVVVVLLVLVTVVVVYLGSRPGAQDTGKVPQWLDLIQEAEREAREGKEGGSRDEMEEFVDLWSKGKEVEVEEGRDEV